MILQRHWRLSASLSVPIYCVLPCGPLYRKPPEERSGYTKSLMKATAIIPAHNEGLRIGRVLKQVTTHPLIAHTIVVDDGSSDQTVEEARKYAVSIISIPYTGKGERSRAVFLKQGALSCSFVMRIL